jgi:hypothetical protein
MPDSRSSCSKKSTAYGDVCYQQRTTCSATKVPNKANSGKRGTASVGVGLGARDRGLCGAPGWVFGEDSSGQEERVVSRSSPHFLNFPDSVLRTFTRTIFVNQCVQESWTFRSSSCMPSSWCVMICFTYERPPTFACRYLLLMSFTHSAYRTAMSNRRRL